MPASRRLGHHRNGRCIYGGFLQVDVFHPELIRQDRNQRAFLDEPELDDHATDRPPPLGGLVARFGELLLGDEPTREQQLFELRGRSWW